MPKFPIISGDKATKAFKRLGYEEIRQRGSHVRLKHPSDINRRPLSIPRHKTLGRELLLGR